MPIPPGEQPDSYSKLPASLQVFVDADLPGSLREFSPGFPVQPATAQETLKALRTGLGVVRSRLDAGSGNPIQETYSLEVEDTFASLLGMVSGFPPGPDKMSVIPLLELRNRDRARRHFIIGLAEKAIRLHIRDRFLDLPRPERWQQRLEDTAKNVITDTPAYDLQRRIGDDAEIISTALHPRSVRDILDGLDWLSNTATVLTEAKSVFPELTLSRKTERSIIALTDGLEAQFWDQFASGLEVDPKLVIKRFSEARRALQSVGVSFGPDTPTGVLNH